MKRITQIAILISIVLVTKNSLSLSDLEKYKLFTTAKEIKLVSNYKQMGYDVTSEGSLYAKMIKEKWESLWPCPSKVTVECWDMEYYQLFKDKSLFKNSNPENTLIVYFSSSNNYMKILYLNSKKKATDFFKRTSFPVPPSAMFSANSGAYIDDHFAVKCALENLKSTIDCLKLDKKEGKKCKKSLKELKSLKEETIFFSSQLFDSTQGLSMKKFKSIYQYPFVSKQVLHKDKNNFFSSKINIPKDYNLLVTDLDKVYDVMGDSSIRYIAFTIKYWSSSGSGYSGACLYIYDKTKKTIIPIGDLLRGKIDKSFVKYLKKKIDKN